MNLDWVTGFIEGEGCFSILFIKAKSNKLGYQIKPMFAIKLVESEVDVLKEIRLFFNNIGNIYFESNSSGRAKRMKNANDSFSFRISRLEEIKELVKKMSGANFVSKEKERDFKKWCKCIEIIDKKEHLSKVGFLKIAKLRESMHKRKQYNKQTFCQIRIDVDPCEIYKKTKKIPKDCDKCNDCICTYDKKEVN